MRVFVEKDIEGVVGVSVEGDERIVEFEMTLRKKGGRRASNAEYKAAVEEPLVGRIRRGEAETGRSRWREGAQRA